jgi:hypothetical protein
MRQPAAAPRPATQPLPSASAANAFSPEANSAFEGLSARGGKLSPGMREVARKETAGERVDLVRAEGRDVCVRVAFEANAPVVARLVDSAGNVLVANASAATEGVLGERGPVCVRKGEVVACVADGGPARIRWVAWEAP